jgi:hypothetical protein
MSEFEEKAVVVKKTGDASEDVNLVEVITSGGNPRGIPSAVFIVSPILNLSIVVVVVDSVLH